MANHLKEIQKHKLEELKLALNRDELQQYYTSHTYKETLDHYRTTYGCSKDNLKLLFKHFNIERKGRGYNLQDTEARKAAMLAKYGVDNPQKSKEIRERTELTNLERYGTKNVFQNVEVQVKQKQTCIARYGVENVFQAEPVKNIIKQTCVDRYGVEHVSKCPKIISKSRQTKLERYGDSGYHNYEQMKQTNLARYGEPFYLNKEKRKQTSLKHFGVEHPSKCRDIHVKAAKTRSKAIAIDGTKFDSGWEVLVYEYALQKGYSIETQVPINYNDSQITFIDFKINGKLYEVKGTHLLNNCWQEKGISIDDKLKCYKENNVTIITNITKLNYTDPELVYQDINKLSF